MKIYFGINVPHSGKRIATWNPRTYEPVTLKRDLFFEICDICGSGIPPGRLKRGLTTCSPPCNKIKWERVERRERAAIGERPRVFWAAIKTECFNRDNYICQECGRELGFSKGRQDVPECHHKVPVFLGGNNELSNLITLCHKCHTKAHPKGYQRVGRRMRENRPLPLT